MKSILVIMLAVLALPAASYQVGGVSRAKFASSSSQEEGHENSGVPGQQGVQTRSFTSYGTRSGGWRQGVKTQTVQTPSAVSTPAKPQGKAVNAPAPVAAPKPEANPAANPKPQIANTSKASFNNPKEDSENEAANKDAAMPDMAAAAQQMQGLQSMMGMMNALTGGGGGGGMPDLSSMMGGAGGVPGGKVAAPGGMPKTSMPKSGGAALGGKKK